MIIDQRKQNKNKDLEQSRNRAEQIEQSYN